MLINNFKFSVMLKEPFFDNISRDFHLLQPEGHINHDLDIGLNCPAGEDFRGG